MKITDVQGLYVAHNKVEDFNVLIAAGSTEDAMRCAVEYFNDAYMAHNRSDIEISHFDDVTTRFDCDYVVSDWDAF